MWFSQKTKEQKGLAERQLRAQPGFANARCVVMAGGIHGGIRGLALADAGDQLGCWVNGKVHVVPAAALISAELNVDGMTETKVSRNSQAASAAVGGLLFGGVGAVIGGLSSKQTSKRVVKSVELRLLIDDLHFPSHSIEFMENSSTHYELTAKPMAAEWFDLMRVVAHKAQTPA
jgi:hypothetical protein